MTNNATNTSNPVTVAQCGTGGSSFTAFSPLAAGTTSTNPWQSIGTGSSGQVLTSSGAGSLPTWQDSTATVLQSTSVVLTSAEVKALHTTPITIIPAPGANKAIVVFNMIGKLTYGGNNAFSGTGSVSLYYNSDATPESRIATVINNINVTANRYGLSNGIDFSAYTSTPLTLYENLPIVAVNDTTAITGNAANDNTITVVVFYSIADLT